MYIWIIATNQRPLPTQNPQRIPFSMKTAAVQANYVSAYASSAPPAEQLEKIAKRENISVEKLVQQAKLASVPTPTEQRVLNLVRRIEKENG